MPPNNSRELKNTRNAARNVKGTTIDHYPSDFIQHSVPADGSFYEETFAIVNFVILCLIGRNTNVMPSRIAKKVLELTRGILARHDVFNSMCSNLNFDGSNFEGNFNAVAEAIFEDGHTNWGRLIALFGFSGKVVEHMRSQGFNVESRIVQLTTRFIVDQKKQWIQAKGGWGNVITHFENSPQNDGYFSLHNRAWFKGILVTATATIGLGALLAVSCK